MNRIESDLATIADDARLSATVDEVLARGDQIRRRRHRRIAFSGVAAAAAAAVFGTVALPPGGPGGLPSAAAAWGPAAVNIHGTDLAEATEVCSHNVVDLGVGDMPTDLEPIAADQRTGTAVLVYRWKGALVDCVLRVDSGYFVPSSVGAQPWVGLPAGTSIAGVSLAYSNGSPDDEVPDPIQGINGGSLIARVADDVAAVYLDIDGKLYQAEVEGGFATLWLPPGTTERQADSTAIIRAFDSDANELEASTMEDLTPYDGGAVPGDE